MDQKGIIQSESQRITIKNYGTLVVLCIAVRATACAV